MVFCLTHWLSKSLISISTVWPSRMTAHQPQSEYKIMTFKLSAPTVVMLLFFWKCVRAKSGWERFLVLKLFKLDFLKFSVDKQFYCHAAWRHLSTHCWPSVKCAWDCSQRHKIDGTKYVHSWHFKHHTIVSNMELFSDQLIPLPITVKVLEQYDPKPLHGGTKVQRYRCMDTNQDQAMEKCVLFNKKKEITIQLKVLLGCLNSFFISDSLSSTLTVLF